MKRRVAVGIASLVTALWPAIAWAHAEQGRVVGLVAGLRHPVSGLDHVLEVRWPRLVRRLPGYAVGTLGAFWTIQRTFLLLTGARG